MAALPNLPPDHSPPPSEPLYRIEDTIAAFADTAEAVPPEQEQEFLEEFQKLLARGREKRDSLGHTLTFWESQAALAEQEIKRLQQRKARYQRLVAKVEEYIVRVIRSLGDDGKGNLRKLEGNTVTFSAQSNPPSVVIGDDSKVPADFKIASVTLKLPLVTWEQLLDSLDPDTYSILMDGATIGVAPSKTAIRAAIDADQEVPGAGIAEKTYRLVRR